MKVNAARLMLGLFLLAAAQAALAHEPTLTKVAVVFKNDQSYWIEVFCDLDAALAEVQPGHVTPEDYQRLRALSAEELRKKVDELHRKFRNQIRLRFDGQALEPERIEFPDFKPDALNAIPSAPASAAAVSTRETAAPASNPASHPTASTPLLGKTVRLTGRIPEGAKTFTFWASRTFDAISLSIEREGQEELFLQAYKGGNESQPYPLDAPPPVQGTLTVAAEYLRLGFEHIIPKGLDHILFVLGLYLLSPRLKPLLWQVTAFTLAHSVTLALSMYGIVRLSPAIVEPLIALSIAYVAIENIFTSKLNPWRPVIVFAFGLLHGLGFAGVLSELGLPRGQFVTGLISFNVGVECGQLAVILGAFLVCGWFRGRAWYRKRIVIPASVAIALTAIYWTVERTLGT